MDSGSLAGRTRWSTAMASSSHAADERGPGPHVPQGRGAAAKETGLFVAELSRRPLLLDPRSGGFRPVGERPLAYLPGAGNDYAFGPRQSGRTPGADPRPAAQALPVLPLPGRGHPPHVLVPPCRPAPTRLPPRHGRRRTRSLRRREQDAARGLPGVEAASGPPSPAPASREATLSSMSRSATWRSPVFHFIRGHVARRAAWRSTAGPCRAARNPGPAR